MNKEVVNTENAPKAIGPYEQAIKIGEFVYASGQIPLDPKTGNLVDGGITVQTRRVMENLKAVIEAAGNKPKRIEEYVGRVNSGAADVSIARMRSPGGWIEPGQTPEFDEYTLVIRGLLRVSTAEGAIDVHAGEAVIAQAGEWVQYSTPSAEGAEYVSICIPAFGADIVHRDN